MKICLSNSAPDIDRVLKLAGPGDTIQLCGVGHTRGNWGFADYNRMLQDGVVLEGQGPETVIRLVDPIAASGRPDKDANILWVGAGCVIRNLTLDLNPEENLGLNLGGVRFHGKVTMENVTIRGLRGSKAGPGVLGVEVFGVSGSGDTGGSLLRNVSVETDSPDCYCSGIFLGGTLPTPERSLVEDCNVRLPLGWFGFSANYGTTFRRCGSTGCRAWFHNDTGPTTECIIEDCHGEAEMIVRLVATDPELVRQVVVLGGCFGGKRGAEVWDKTKKGMPGCVRFVGTKLGLPELGSIWSPKTSFSAIACELPETTPFWRRPFDVIPELIACKTSDGKPVVVDIRTLQE